MKVYCAANDEAVYVLNGRYAGMTEGPWGASIVFKTAEEFYAYLDRLPTY